MALFEFDFGRMRREAAAAQRLAEARSGFRNVILARNGVPVAPDALAGVTGTNAVGDLQAELRNEELATAAGAAQSQYDANLADSIIALKSAGVDPAGVMTALESADRRRAIEGARSDMTGAQYLDAINNKSVAPFSLNTSGIINKYDGEYRSTPSVDALAEQRRMAALKEQAAAGNQDALAAYNAARGQGEQTRNRVIEDILQEPTSPLVAGDIVNRHKLSAPRQVKVRLRDGSEQLMDAVPNQRGGFDYMAATAGGAPLVSAPGGAGDDRTALQSDTDFIAETLNLPKNEALLFKLQTGRKPPEEAWADTVARVVSSSKWSSPEEIKTKSEQVWALARPNQPIPTSKAGGAGVAPVADTASADDAKARALADPQLRNSGYSNFGNWVPGKGLEVLDNSGRVVGHYY